MRSQKVNTEEDELSGVDEGCVRDLNKLRMNKGLWTAISAMRVKLRKVAMVGTVSWR